MNTSPIGIFDSGMGGLTVLKALKARLPRENLVYLGDTARLPYGTKSAETVTQYALQAARALMRHEIKMIVVACNTASSVALGPLAAALAPLPVIGVIEPGAQAAVAASKTGRIAVIATERTVQEGVYPRAIAALNKKARVAQQACALFVALAEEGWLDGAVTQAAAREYLSPLLARDAPDTLLLGCTHFPVLAAAIAQVAGPEVVIVDSAETTAQAVANALAMHGLQNPNATPGGCYFLATDGVERFARIGGRFLGEAILPEQVELVNLMLSS